MNLLRIRIHHLIEQLGDEELESVWHDIHALHCDFYMRKAIQQAQRSLQPWDILTYDEAVRMLMFV
ncbi:MULTISPECIES: hypothetical protein [unclassified Anabaena]|uniref:hypothetical protein n=1 Tax=unclassified Anabaena TaxID=2619674 RepID=UPI00082CD985|nr:MULTISPECIES: hypothetical protein [unclassified Anabaena]